MATNGRNRYFHTDENTISEQIYDLLDMQRVLTRIK